MSRKHFFKNPEGVVVHMLQSLVTRNSHMALDEPNRVVYNVSHPPNQVTIVSGGGSGHEPAWSGFVGDGMLSAAVCGDIFASPSTKQIMAGIRNVPSNEGVILCITNYTGDMLHFGLAREKGQALGYKVDVVCMAEDAALGRKQSGKVGRRGLAGNLLGMSLALETFLQVHLLILVSHQTCRSCFAKRLGVRACPENWWIGQFTISDHRYQFRPLSCSWSRGIRVSARQFMCSGYGNSQRACKDPQSWPAFFWFNSDHIRGYAQYRPCRVPRTSSRRC